MEHLGCDGPDAGTYQRLGTFLSRRPMADPSRRGASGRGWRSGGVCWSGRGEVGRSGRRRWLIDLGAVNSSRPSAPRVRPKPLRAAPPKGSRGSAVGAMRSLMQTEPARTRGAKAAAGVAGPKMEAPRA